MSTLWKTLIERITCKATPDMGKITTKDDAELRRMHRKWMVKIGRRYVNAEEEERRFRIFKQTVEECERHNAMKKGHIAGLTCFADITSEEFTAMFPPISYPPWVYAKMREERERKALRKALRYVREREALRYAGPPEDLTCFGCGGPY